MTFLILEQAVDDHLAGKKHQRLNNLRDSRQQQTERSVFVGGLCRLNGELELEDYFSKFGEIAKIIIDKDKVSKAPLILEARWEGIDKAFLRKRLKFFHRFNITPMGRSLFSPPSLSMVKWSLCNA